MSESVQAAIAEQVLGLYPDSSKVEWGQAFLELAGGFDEPEFAVWLEAREHSSLGAYVAAVKSAKERRAQHERLMARGLAVATGRPINPAMSIRRDGYAPTSMLWTEAQPQEFIEAVMREQRVVQGRLDANAARLALVALMKDDEHLLSLPSLGHVCDELGIDPDTLGLGDLETGT